MKDNKWFPFLKLKASYGTLGQQDEIGYYAGRDLYDIKNNNGELALALKTKGNADLTWEKASMLQLGLDFNVGKFLTGSIEYYNKISTDLIYDRRVAPSNGYAIIKVNDGRLQNQGLDLDLTAHILKNKNKTTTLISVSMRVSLAIRCFKCLLSRQQANQNTLTQQLTLMVAKKIDLYMTTI